MIICIYCWVMLFFVYFYYVSNGNFFIKYWKLDLVKNYDVIDEILDF